MTTSAYRVIKFGGSSVGRAQSLRQIIDTIAAEHAQGPLAVVVSAMGDTTDWLLDAVALAAKGQLDEAEQVVDRLGDLATTTALMVLRDADPARAQRTVSDLTQAARALLAPLRQMLLGVSLLQLESAQATDAILSFGERLSVTVISGLLRAFDLPAFALDARDWTLTDATYGQARVDWDASRDKLVALRAGWDPRAIPICTGFIGQTPDGRTTTLGRNGSDYTAALLARALEASELIICTDVSGVMTADPRIVSDAYPVSHLSYLEALELANYGAKMFHARTMLPLIASSIPMRIRNTMDREDPGTLIGASRPEGARGPTCVTSLERLALVDVRWRQLEQQAQMGHRVLHALERANVSVWMATQAAHGQAVAVALPLAQLDLAHDAIHHALRAELERGEVEAPRVIAPVTLLSLVAEQMQQTHNPAGRFFHTLAGVGVSVLAIAQGQSSRSISCVIHEADTALAVRTTHAAFNFAHQPVSVCLMGKGVVGAQLIAQLAAQRELLRRDHDLDLRLVGLIDSARVLLDPDGLDPNQAIALLDDPARSQPRTEASLEDALERLRRLPVPILVDCTSADDMDLIYQRAFAHQIHVVAANKKPLTIAWPAREALMRAARLGARAYRYETTVGASLPVIETLKDLVRTGDRVRLIEGAFSGTLGFLTNEIMAGVPLSRAVRQARELGYTEPRPQDDLSGLDVARKALILARELGFALSLEDVEVTPLVPAALLDTPTAEALLEALEAHDAEVTARAQALRERGAALRYLAILDPEAARQGLPALRVGPVEVEADHPAARLRGAEAFVAFTTDRYSTYPLIVQGAGAGGAVTAAGVLADVLRVAQQVRGR